MSKTNKINMLFKNKNLLTLKEASEWASREFGRSISTSNISYLVQYGRVKRYSNNSTIYVNKSELERYYKSFRGKREIQWKKILGEDLNWHLSFDHLREVDTTKHVHRLHPYKGKFIPQLVEYFLDDHTDEFKKEVFFKRGDIILDPFCGSGTTLVQANELGMHAVGVDVSDFNALISNAKIKKYNFHQLHIELQKITRELRKYITDQNIAEFDEELTNKLAVINNKYFPSPDYKYKLRNNEIDEEKYSPKYVESFRKSYWELIRKYNIKLNQDNQESFIDIWYLYPVRKEIDLVFNLLKRINNLATKKIICIILSRTIRSCRATTHSDLATLVNPVTEPYYCTKHNKICKPLYSILGWWSRYSKDTIHRLSKFNSIRTDTFQYCLTGDSRTIDIFNEIEERDYTFASIIKKKKFSGIFSSPPYVGLIDYHEQHAYAYDLFGFKRRDELEIGPLYNGKGREARESYINGIVEVLLNCQKYLVKDYNVFLVANDKFNLYPIIAGKSGMKIVNQYKRPVLNRTERDKGAYSEIIFHIKEK
jgi:hypothetical protein